MHKAVTGEEIISLDQAWADFYPSEEEDPQLGMPAVITGINWQGITLAFYRDRQVNGKKICGNLKARISAFLVLQLLDQWRRFSDDDLS